MSNEAAAGTDNTGKVNAEGTETTAIGAADGVVAEGAAVETKAAGTEKPAGDGAEKTALASAGDDGAAAGEAANGDEGKGEGEEGEKKDGEEGEGGDPVTEALDEVELPEGFTVSDEDKGALAEFSKAHNLSKDAVKDLIALETKRKQAAMQAAKKATTEFVGKMKAEALKLPKETLVGAHKFVQKFGSEGLKAKMADPAFYIGNDVDIINAFAMAQKAVDGGFVDGVSAGGGAAKSAGEVLYK